MNAPIKRVAAAHDLSGFGRCALSVIIPVLSVMGVQVCSLPTAVMSTHTGGFDGYTFLDLTGELERYYRHWKSLDLTFDAIYSGFLGNEKQIGQISDMIDLFQSPVVLVDPVMGDDGVLYSTYNNALKEGMKRLIEKATVITPNITEAAFLLDEEPRRVYSERQIDSYLERLAARGIRMVVITGIHRGDRVTTSYIDQNGRKGSETLRHIDKNYPGTGDIFSSVLLGELLEGKELAAAAARASEFVRRLVEYSSEFNYEIREGVLLEAKLNELKKS